MNLNFKKYGEGSEILIILHGLFGSLDNWQTLAKVFSENFTVYILDQRNHGKSPHTKNHNYVEMANDLEEFMNQNNIDSANLLGHSMGGKTVMQFAITNPQMVDKLIVADIAPKYYPPHHQTIIKALTSIDFNLVNDRNEAKEIISKHIEDEGTAQFLLKNLTWVTKSKLGWKFNLNTLVSEIENIGEALEGYAYFTNPTLFIRGTKSDYILDDDIETIEEIFPLAEIVDIENAGHWLHAENPKAFSEAVIDFLS